MELDQAGPSSQDMWVGLPPLTKEDCMAIDQSCELEATEEDSFDVSPLPSPSPLLHVPLPSCETDPGNGTGSRTSSRTSSAPSNPFPTSRQSSFSSIATTSSTTSNKRKSAETSRADTSRSSSNAGRGDTTRRRDDPGVPVSLALQASSHKRRRVDDAAALPTPESAGPSRITSRPEDDFTLPTFSKDGQSIVRKRPVTPPAVAFYRPASPNSPTPHRPHKLDSNVAPHTPKPKPRESTAESSGGKRVNGTPVVLDQGPRLPAPRFPQAHRAASGSTSARPSTPNGKAPSSAYVTPASAPPPAQTTRPASSGSPTPAAKKPAIAQQYIQSYDRLIAESPLSLETEIIAFDKSLQRALDEKNVAWSVQFEVYRGITRGWWKPDEVLKKIGELVGDEKILGPKVPKILGRYKDNVNPNIFVEYERENAAIVEGLGRGLGLMGPFRGDDNWHGGHIQQIVRRETIGNAVKYILEKPEMKRSHRVARFMGSRRVLELRIPKSERFAIDAKVLVKKFVLAGRVFVPFDAKDGKVYMVETDEDYSRTPDDTCGDDKRISFTKFLQWHNSLSRNFTQPTSKWVTRFDLGLSTSVPACEFGPENIFYIDDQFTRGATKSSPAENCLTDGCGFISYSALVAIRKQVGLVDVPTAVQGRVAGGKGLFIRKPGDDDPAGPLKVWLRASQHKIKLGDLGECSRAQRIFDLVGPARVTQPARLNTQLMLNYSANGVPNDVMLDLFTETVKQDVEPLMRFSGLNWPLLLYGAIERSGNISSMRLQRLAGGKGRVLGVSGRFEAEREERGDDDDDTDTQAEEKRLMGSEDAPDTGAPSSPFERALRLLESGFSPSEEPHLHDLMRTIVKMTLNNLLDKYHVVLPRSAEMFIIPDPTGRLKPGQIHVRVSRAVVDPDTGVETNTVLGPVLVSRNPARIASDVQKVVAVEIPDCPELAKYTNVIVMSTNPDCPRSLASYLGGGDYDGDTAMVVWEPRIVNAFKNHDFIDMPKEAMSRFSSEPERLPKFYDRLAHATPQTKQSEVVKALLGGLGDRKVGSYSELHELRAYYFGYNDQETIMLAYLFCICLDSHKSGHRLIPAKFEADSTNYRLQKPACMRPRSDEEGDQVDKTGTYLRQPKRSEKGLHILDAIRKRGNTIYDKYMAMLDDSRKGVAADKQLFSKYESAREQAVRQKSSNRFPQYAQELELVTRHVRVAYDAYRDEMKKYAKSPKQADELSRKTKTSKAVREIVRQFASQPKDTPVPNDLDTLVRMPAADPLLRASYAYFYATHARFTDKTQKADQFPFEVAFYDLCRLKVETHPDGWRPIIYPLIDILNPQRSALQVLASQGD